MLASRRLAALLTLVLMVAAGCSTTGTSSSAPSAPPVPDATSTAAPVATATPAAIASSTPSPAPVAIKEGEPWIVYQWLADANGDGVTEQGVYLVRPEGRDQHPLLTDPASPSRILQPTRTGHPMASGSRSRRSPPKGWARSGL
jgi:ABC-type Fe3+-hydroxamate transport system substrate-binding protein